MIPDPLLILPFALTGLIWTMHASGRGTMALRAMPGSTVQHASRILSLQQRKNRILKFGALAIAPATLVFPSGMLLYWISSSLAAVFMDSLPRGSHLLAFQAAWQGGAWWGRAKV